MPALPSWPPRASTIVSSAEPLSSHLLCATRTRCTQVNGGPAAPAWLGLHLRAAGPRMPLIPLTLQPMLLMVSLTALACRTRRRSNSRPRSHARWLLMVRCPRHIAPVPRTAQELWLHACQAHSPRAAGSWSCVPTAVLRASQTDLACARARPLAGQYGVLRSFRTPPRRACKRTGSKPSRCARARLWRARPLSRPPARAHTL